LYKLGGVFDKKGNIFSLLRKHFATLSREKFEPPLLLPARGSTVTLGMWCGTRGGGGQRVVGKKTVRGCGSVGARGGINTSEEGLKTEMAGRVISGGRGTKIVGGV